MNGTPRSIRKAAILLASLDPRHAEELLAQMPQAQAEALREAIDHLGPIEAAEQDEVIEEFFRIGPLVPEDDASGIELDAPLGATSATLATGGQAAMAATPFRCLSAAPADKLAPFLERERPQTAAVVLAHLPADRAAEILAHLSADTQAEVARRLADLADPDPEVLGEVERGLESYLSDAARGAMQKQGGIAALATILGAAQPQAREKILSNLARHDRELAERLEPRPAAPPPSFTDLERLDRESLLAVFEAGDAELVTLALAGAAPRFAERALEILGAKRAAALRRAMCNLGPTPLADIEHAQRQLAHLAAELEARGRISPRTLGRLSVAA